MDGIITGQTAPNKEKEIEAIRKVCQKGKLNLVKPTKVDVFVQSNDDSIFLFDIKTVKPNIGNFKEFKRTLLEWVATVLAENPNASVNTLIAIPYNPYEPKPYERWTMKGILDIDSELKVVNEFWDFLGGEGSYDELLNCFERVGIELRPEIDKYFSKFK
jgi:type II restriction enzyme